MFCRNEHYLSTLIGLGVSFTLLVGCSSATKTTVPTSKPPAAEQPATSAETPPEINPTPAPTEIPMAARVNEIEITLQEYQIELDLYQQARGTEITPEDQQIVLNDLENRALLASAAAVQGFTINDSIIQEHKTKLIAELGSNTSLTDWMSVYAIDEQTFDRMLRLSIAAAWMRDKIIQEIPETAEQVHARQILLYDSAVADDVYGQLQAGNSFQNLALKYDPITGGDLGWFPKGYLPYKAIEDAVFGLVLDQFSQIVETPAGYHILQLLERDPDRALTPDAIKTLQRQALQDWLVQARIESQIEVLLATE